MRLMIGLGLLLLATALLAAGGSKDLYDAGEPGARVVLELDRDGQVDPVDAGTVFLAGDKVRFLFTVNFDGYVTITNKGSSGRSHLLLPNRNRNNRFAAGQEFASPWFTFDATPGREEVIFVLSKNPLPDFAPTSAGTGGGNPAPSADAALDLLNSKALQRGRSRDLVLSPGASAGYVATSAETLAEPTGFSLTLNHR